MAAQPVPAGAGRRWGCLKSAVIIYLLLLLASHGYRATRPAATQPAADTRQVTVAEVTSTAATATTTTTATAAPDRPVTLSYREWPAPDPSPPTVLLIHGSPGRSKDFRLLGPALAQRGFRVLAPDLPGFGSSTSEVADYSIFAHAHYVAELVDQLGIVEPHLVGFSMGGGVVLHLSELLETPVRSLTLLSAIGVQELELLGNYHINHMIHGLQLTALWWLYEAVPHFGVFDGSMLSMAYARNFYDTDQRPLRAILQRFEAPLAVIHGEGDVLVPYEAAQEHHRLVPHSELLTFDANHFMVFRDPKALVTPLADFLHRAEGGTALTRSQATAERLTAAAAATGIRLPPATGPTLLVWMLLLAAATLVSEDLTCIAAGLLVAQGSLGFVPATVACATGIFFGDLMLYGVGRLGQGWLHRRPIRWFVDARAVERSRRWFAQRGPWVIFSSRFLPGTRLPTYVSAGLLEMNLAKFALWLLLPVAIWTPLLVAGARWLGESFFDTFAAFQSYALPTFAALLIGLWICLAMTRTLSTWQGRRRVLGCWRRWTQWEFWPTWLFYPPIILYLIGLAMRYRSATLFTAANPGIPAGGFVGESKSAILDSLPAGSVAPYESLAAGSESSRIGLVEAFMQQQESGFPVVLKPDVGERGHGVMIAHKPADVAAFFRDYAGLAIVQKYVPGVELGVFWVRLPDAASGEIFSITDKQLPIITGDGTSSIERLILADERAVAMAPTYLNYFVERLEEVPSPGETLRLVELGTHCRGAVFLDGSDYATPQLTTAIREIAEATPGFYFGRFDLRAPSYEHFRRGQDIRVLELNGVTSEATHIYDPANSLFDAYRVLFRQWRLAFEIGRQNRQRGFPPASISELVAHIRSARSSESLKTAS